MCVCVCVQMTKGLHEDIDARVGQPQAHQPAGDQHARCQKDGDGLGDAHQRAKDQVSQHGGQLAQGVAEAKAGASAEEGRTSGLVGLR